MNDDLRLSPNGTKVWKAFEGCGRRVGDDQFKAYICPGGKLTIGFGHTNDHGRQFGPDDVWTLAECLAALEEDIFGFECHVRSLVTVPVNQKQFDALVLFAENCGWQALSKSTLLKRLNRGDYAGASREFLKWTHAGPEHRELAGLVRRRHAESAIFSGGPYVAHESGECEMPQSVNEPKAPPSKGKRVATVIAGGMLTKIWAQASDHLDKLTQLKGQLENLGLTFDADWLKSMLSDPHMIFNAALLGLVLYLLYDHARLHKEDHA